MFWCWRQKIVKNLTVFDMSVNNSNKIQTSIYIQLIVLLKSLFKYFVYFGNNLISYILSDLKKVNMCELAYVAAPPLSPRPSSLARL